MRLLALWQWQVALASQPQTKDQDTNLSIQTSLAALYTLLSLPLFYSSASTTLLILTALDVLLLLAFTIISVLLGRPISHLNCRAIRSASAASSAAVSYTHLTLPTKRIV